MQFTDELLADGKRRYEQTSEPLDLIATDFGIHRTTFTNMAKGLGWVRHQPSARELSAAARLLAQTEKLEAEMLTALQAPPPAAAEGDDAAPDASVAPPDALPNALPESIAASIDWLHRGVRGQIAAVEALRARLNATRQTVQEAAVISRTLVSLTGALHKLQHMACGPLPVGQNGQDDDDDLPEDLDEFRNELARRIRVFVASRTGTGDAERPGAAPDVDAAGG